MAYAATKQDMQGLVEYAKNTILERMASKSQMQTIADQVRVSILQNLNELHAENQQAIRTGQTQRDQIMARVVSIEQNMHAVEQALNRVAGQMARIEAMLQRI